ncbi:putative zinc metallopeptidase protein [Botrytis cinerea BcDW1]|uniref:Similar to zinc ion binding protein n=2 Tax=Botryotinia fuckeliana TaxID=40559 RepID=G2Y1Y2_BOTF4|nr:putative zinc metallopeptidase protein [Botrytis cinerea BcDW1]CCD46672.1 similar to zinc ion binding protein [Botrytis cinerea T4]
MSTNTERDALISSYSHLKGMKREAEALHSLKKIASLVKPIMRARHWRVGTLTEFYPDQQNLLGLNVNRGQKICLRLRYPGDQNQFLPIEEVVDTMLHELCHNEIGPHNQEFHALWDQLRKEHEGLVNKGYTGEGFLSEGKSLGGRRVPRHEARRLARIAAEKRQNSPKGSDQKLGGRPVPYGTDIRKVIVDAIERRNKVLKGCGESRMNPIEIKDLADEATHNGFKTLAEEDLANDAAIAQAMWELVREDQKKEYGDLYVPPSVQNPAGTSGGNIGGRASDENSIKSKSPPKLKDPQNEPAQGPVYSAPTLTGWTCTICTLHNPIDFLCCDACTTERPESITKQIDRNSERKTAARPLPPQPQMWTCRWCSTKMENQWWTCSTCGKMKESS